MAKLIDHLVLPVEDIAIARERFTALGFSVGADSQHPFGTENCYVHFQGQTFLELLGVAQREVVEEEARKGLTFLRRDQAYRFRHGQNGFDMIALRSEDAAVDLAAFEAEGFAEGELYTFSKAATPDQGVKLAYAVDDRAPDASFFTCERFGDITAPTFVSHANSSSYLASILMVEDNPSDFQYYMQCAFDEREMDSHSFGVSFNLPNCEIEALTPAGYQGYYGESFNLCGRGLRFAGIVLRVSHLDDVVGAFDSSVEYRKDGNRILVAPTTGQGLLIVFEEFSDDGEEL